MNGDWIISPNEIIEPPRFPIGSLLESINMQAVYRNKRAFDFLFSILAFVFSPLLILVIDRKTGFVKNVFQVLLCNKSWIGYDPRGMDRTLPKLKAGVIHPSMHLIWPENHIENSYNVNVRYLNSTSLFSDFQLVVRHIHNLGNQ
jgi:lipopolysaccharide/colanic/teichoic acid biosynthesis glycosyltransferase